MSQELDKSMALFNHGGLIISVIILEKLLLNIL